MMEKKWTSEEWKIFSRASKQRMVLRKNLKEMIYRVYRKTREPHVNDLIFETKEMSELKMFFDEQEKEREGSYRDIKGDLIKLAKEGEFDIIAHGCNCFATFGAGIAPQIGKAFPESKHADQISNLSSLERLGNFTSSSDAYQDKKGQHFHLTVYNLYTQYMPGSDFQIDAFTIALRKMAWEIKEHFADFIDEGIKIGLPLIGCGIGGGDWDEVSKIIKHELREFDVTIVHWDKA